MIAETFTTAPSTQHLKPKIAISAGGTGGHIIPALAVALELRSQGAEVFYIGNAGSLEEDIISRHNIPFYAINVQKIYRAFTLKHFLFPFKLIKSIFACRKHLKAIKPDAFVGFGGYVSGPPAFAAWLMRIPVYLQEQNCRPGLTNRWTGKFAKGVFLAHSESRKFFNKKKAIVTGNPILKVESRKSEVEKKDLDIFLDNITSSDKVLFVVGGSQGSLFINSLVLENLEYLLSQGYKIIWQTGKKHLETMRNAECGMQNEEGLPLKVRDIEAVLPFDFTDNIHSVYQKANYVITRGGALCLAEIDTHSIPAFIIPLSTAAVNEQYHNAIAMENSNKGLVFLEKDKALFQEKWGLFIQKTKDMYIDIKPSPHMTAAKTIVSSLLEVI